jgi:hypothetical protein
MFFVFFVFFVLFGVRLKLQKVNPQPQDVALFFLILPIYSRFLLKEY